MPQKKAVPTSPTDSADPWMRVAHMAGRLAATAGTACSSNPHPPDSGLARCWTAGWDSTRPVPASRQKGLRHRLRSSSSPPQPKQDYSMIDLIERLPAMADADLTTLASNAERLALSGTPKQRTAADAALPAIRAEVAARKEKLAALPSTRAPRRSKKVAAAVDTPQ